MDKVHYISKYNVVNMKQLYNNQYMQNIRAANDEGKEYLMNIKQVD